MTLFALSGFLGTAKDWQGVPVELEPDFPQVGSLKEWAESFNIYASAFKAPRVLLGYSLGGRKALHALLDREELWSQAILISTHPGLVTENEREARTAQDLIWAERFLTEDWDAVMHAWNAQPVFAGSSSITRQCDRKRAAHDLMSYSLGKQQDLRESIARLETPILWIAGAKDPKFTQISQEMAGLHLHSQSLILKEFGHRINFQLIYELIMDKLPREVKNGHLEKDQRLSGHQV
jgi:2-succinyl-6-hydroxy-2,4-cyclohexadiene-1-carboxylate synthase